MFGLIPWRRTEPALLTRSGDPFEMMNREFGSLANRIFGEWPTLLPEVNWERFWGVTTEELEGERVIRFELPGFEVGEIEVHLAGNVLTVEAAHKAPEGKEEETRRVRREMTLSSGLNLEALEAHYRNGILEVHVPRLPEAQGRRIEVKA